MTESVSRVSRLAVVLAGGIVLCGCTPAHHAAIELDKVARSIDRYGFASISTPFLAGPSDTFDFDLDKPASEFFDMAFKPQGGVRHLSAEALDFQVAFRANIEQAFATLLEFQKVTSLAEFRVAKAKAGMQKKILQSLIGGGDEGAGSTYETAVEPFLIRTPALTALIGVLGAIEEMPEPDIPEVTPEMKGPPTAGPPFTTEQLRALASVGTDFTRPPSLPDEPFRLSAREALMIASGDVMTQRLLNWFLQPHENKLWHYELFFCPMAVSVQPGYQTRDRYVADITVNVDLAKSSRKCACPRNKDKVCDRHLEFLSDRFHDSSPPILVAGVFPVIDSQVLNLVNSRRQLYSVALQLSLMGFGSQADFFSNYARRLEQDAQTQTALTAASAYTVGDTAFGFRVEPKFVASKDPTQLTTEPGRVLESRTFPAMAAVLVDRKYLKMQRDWCCPEGERRNCKEEDCADCAQCSDCGKKDRDPYDFLVFETSTRWAPMTELRRFFGGALSLGGRYSEVEAWSRALALDKADEWLKYNKRLIHSIDDTEHVLFGWNPPFFFGKVRSTYQRAHLESRAKILRRLALDSRAIVRVFDKGPAQRICVESVHPKHGWWDQHTVLNIRGQGFAHNVRYVTVGGIPCDFATPNDRILLVAVPPWGQVKKNPPKRLGNLAEAIASLPVGAGGIRTLEAPIAPEQTEARKQIEESAVCAEISIAAHVPICVKGEGYCRDTFPCKGVRKALDCSNECEGIGWVRFDKRLPKGSVSGGGGKEKEEKGPKVIIKYNKDNQGIESVETQGDFNNSARLLELIREVLKRQPDVDFELNAEGGVRVGASAKAKDSGDARKTPDGETDSGP